MIELAQAGLLPAGGVMALGTGLFEFASMNILMAIIAPAVILHGEFQIVIIIRIFIIDS